MNSSLRSVLVLTLATLTATLANASIVYRMTGGTTAPDPFTGATSPVTAEIRLSDNYVLGQYFMGTYDGVSDVVESFHVDFAYGSYGWSPGPFSGEVSGYVSDLGVYIHYNCSYYNSCGINIEGGPNGGSWNSYEWLGLERAGGFASFARVPEPGTLFLALTAVLGVVVSRRNSRASVPALPAAYKRAEEDQTGRS